MKAIFRAICSTALLGVSAVSSASNLEDEKPIAEVRSSNGTNTMRVSAYLQARFEYGDLTFGPDHATKGSEFDLYFRKVALGVYGTALLPNLRYGFTLSADETAQKDIFPSYSEENGASLNGTYLQYFYTDSHFIKIGKDKLPLSRVYLTSSTQQLFAERPYYTYAWRDVLRTYAQTNLSAGGKLLDSTLRYEFSVSKAFRYGDALYRDTDILVNRASPFTVARLEWSPPGWIESSRSDAHLGNGRHLAVGAYTARQGHVDFRSPGLAGSETRRLYGYDVSFHWNALTAQAEANSFDIDSTLPGATRRAGGWYVQTSYLLKQFMAEPALRYESFTMDKARPDTSVKVLTVGLNQYIKGHSLKWSINWERTLFDRNVDLLRPQDAFRKDALRTTLQFVF